jgi:hypothetical protein
MARKAKKVEAEGDLLRRRIEKEVQKVINAATMLKDGVLVRIRGKNYTFKCQKIDEAIEFVRRVIAGIEAALMAQTQTA